MLIVPERITSTTIASTLRSVYCNLLTTAKWGGGGLNIHQQGLYHFSEVDCSFMTC